MNIETTVNTSDEIIFENVYINSRRPLKWVKSLPEHEGHAVIVGGGPSLKDWLHEIKIRQRNGQIVFALNHTALFLSEHGIEPTQQIILDARVSNISFLGSAKHHYLASQCHLALFDKAKNVTLWHQHYPDDLEKFDASLPSYDDDYSLIGGGTTVGLSAMALVYTLGYRQIHLYGYDSSFRDDNSHAYQQDDPQMIICESTAAGKTFKTTLSMAQQAELFPILSDKLIDLGCTITIRGDGLLPHISKMSEISNPISEKEKYEQIWTHKEYRDFSPGEECLHVFTKLVSEEWGIEKTTLGPRIIDFG